MRKVIVFSLFLLLATSVFAQKIPLVWQVDREKFWEEDWLHDILEGVELINVECETETMF